MGACRDVDSHGRAQLCYCVTVTLKTWDTRPRDPVHFEEWYFEYTSKVKKKGKHMATVVGKVSHGVRVSDSGVPLCVHRG